MTYNTKRDDSGNIYIHRTWESFKRQSGFVGEKYGQSGAKSREKEIFANYKKQASITKKRNESMMGSVDKKTGKKIISDIQQLYQNLDDIMNPNAILEVKNMIETLKNDIKIDSLMWTAKKAGDSAKNFDDALKKIEEAVKCYNELDSTLVKYIEQSNTSLAGFTKIDDPKKLSMFSFDKKAQTSYTNLLRNLEIANSMVAFGGSGKVEAMTFTDSSGKSQTKEASSLIYGMRQRLINMMGGVGEIAGANVFNRAIEENLINGLKDMKDVNVRLVGDEYRYNAALDREVTRTGDFVIRYTASGGAEVDIGFSVKAQMVKNLPTGKSVTTTYLTSPYESILARAGMLGTDIDYALGNALASGQYASAYGIRKLLASMVGTEAIAGRGNDPVVFLMYLDKITTSHDFLHSLSMGNLSNALDLDFQKNNRTVIESANKKLEKTAYIRSKNVQKILYRTLGQIQYEHK